jgi:hypothetical protein
VVQWFFPRFEIASGGVETGSTSEWHFWNVDPTCSPHAQIDLTWQQFRQGSVTKQFTLLDRNALGDSRLTLQRCHLLLERVLLRLAQ